MTSSAAHKQLEVVLHKVDYTVAYPTVLATPQTGTCTTVASETCVIWNWDALFHRGFFLSVCKPIGPLVSL